MTSNMHTVRHLLLQDHTHYDPNSMDYHAILWATDNYIDHQPSDEMTDSAYHEITPRCAKTRDLQDTRRKTKGEVFTPTWLCNHMNNQLDNTHFNKSNLFNSENPETHTWAETHNYKQQSLEERDKYISLRQLEITCGEAPFLVSPYNSQTGTVIPLTHRIGLLDRKLQWINSTTQTYDEWWKLVLLAYQTTYGFEYSGDNLLIARLNLLNTYHDYYKAQWDKTPSIKNMKTISMIISWNLWQMDGLPTPQECKKQNIKPYTVETNLPHPQHANHTTIRLWEHTNPTEDTILFADCEESE